MCAQMCSMCMIIVPYQHPTTISPQYRPGSHGCSSAERQGQAAAVRKQLSRAARFGPRTWAFRTASLCETSNKVRKPGRFWGFGRLWPVLGVVWGVDQVVPDSFYGSLIESYAFLDVIWMKCCLCFKGSFWSPIFEVAFPCARGTSNISDPHMLK